MSGKTFLALVAGASCVCFADLAAALDASPSAEPTVIYATRPAQGRMAYAERAQLGGGFIEFLFGDGPRGGRYQQQPSYQQRYQQQPGYGYDGRRSLLPPIDPQPSMRQPQEEDETALEPAHRPLDPKYEKQVVAYLGKESPGTIVVDTPNKFLFLVQGDGKALRYGIGVGRPGFTWSGVKTISAKKEWPAWTPPPEMLARRPDLPRHMEGGPQNPLGARAMYLGSTLYRIHGSNEPWTIGTNVSSGCIRMRNEDVIDLYGRVGVGARVVVI
jgi:lipoprotein-anchoring transpeptidase ErfK/SrfK